MASYLYGLPVLSLGRPLSKRSETQKGFSVLFFFFKALWHLAMKFSSNFLLKFLNNFKCRTSEDS